nr:MAG TPA: hypothetical protein [Caudoviricetes sp.]
MTNAGFCDIIEVGIKRAGHRPKGPNFRSLTPYAKFLSESWGPHMRPVFPETQPPG